MKHYWKQYSWYINIKKTTKVIWHAQNNKPDPKGDLTVGYKYI